MALIETSSTRFRLGSEHLEFQQSCRRFVEDVVLPLVEDAEASGTFPAHLLPLMGQSGFLGIGHPEEFGGSGGNTVAMAIFAEELSKSSGGIAITPLVSAYMAGPHIATYANPAQKSRYLSPIISGEKVAAIAVTEPAAGSDVAAIQTRARKDGSSYVIDGRKTFITNGGIADHILVAAKTNPEAGHRGITMFMIEREDEGFTIGSQMRKMGWRSSDTRELFFDGCVVDEDRIVGEPDKGFYQIAHGFQTERVALAAMGVGLAQTALDDALAYAKERTAFGSPISKFQAVRYRLSEMATKIEAARMLTYRAASDLDDKTSHSAETVAMAKLLACRVANEVADDAVQIFGGYGFIEETRVAMHYRDARVLRIGGGTDEVQLEILAKRMGL